MIGYEQKKIGPNLFTMNLTKMQFLFTDLDSFRNQI